MSWKSQGSGRHNDKLSKLHTARFVSENCNSVAKPNNQPPHYVTHAPNTLTRTTGTKDEGRRAKKDLLTDRLSIVNFMTFGNAFPPPLEHIFDVMSLTIFGVNLGLLAGLTTGNLSDADSFQLYVLHIESVLMRLWHVLLRQEVRSLHNY